MRCFDTSLPVPPVLPYTTSEPGARFFEGLEDAGVLFFELFRIFHLLTLTTEECCRLWNTMSEQELSRREIRPLKFLTDRSSRLLVVIAAFARHRSFRQLMEELIGLVDEYTVYLRTP